MKVGIVDADMLHRKKCTFPNLALMKLSAWHKNNGDSVEWYEPMISEHMDIVYVSKVFSDAYTPDIPYEPDADIVIRGGSGYAIELVNGREVYSKALDIGLDDEIEHVYPDYGIYERFGIRDTAYGFITKGCPRGCAFCHVKNMQGTSVYDFSPIHEFWRGQRNIVLLDPNITASKRCVEYFETLARTKAYVEFSQGLDLRLMTPEKWEALSKIKVKSVHFAWDNPKDDMVPRFEDAVKRMRVQRAKHSVYILTNFDSTLEEDVYRVETVKRFGFQPYVMIYNKNSADKRIRKLQRYANNPYICWTVKSFDAYDASVRYGR